MSMTPKEYEQHVKDEATRRSVDHAGVTATGKDYAAARNALVKQLEADGEIPEGSVPSA